MKQKPLELDLSNIERIAERHGVTPKLALDIFNDIHDVAKVLNNDDQFLPSYSNKKVVELGDFTTIHVGQVATNDTNGGRSHELRIRVFQKDTPMSEHTVILPMPGIKVNFVDGKETVNINENWEKYRTMETHPLNAVNKKPKRAKALVSIYCTKGTVTGFSDPKIHRIIYEDEFHLEEEIIKEKRKELTIGSSYDYGLFVGFISLPNSQSHFVESKEPYTKEQVIQLMDMLGKFYKPDLTDYPNVKWHTWGGMASDQLNETSEQLLDRLSPNFTLKSQP